MIEWSTPGKASVLVDGQFGSCGKGLMAAWLAHETFPNNPCDIATCNAGAQAGHTTCYRNGRKFICYHMPTTAVVQRCWAYINAGSIIDPVSLSNELRSLDFENSHNPIIHPRAAIITDEDRQIERGAGSSTEGVASTQKGVGSALSRKIMRQARLAGDVLSNLYTVKRIDLNEKLVNGKSIVVEVPQGTGLSINHGMAYPWCTSRDCTVMAGLSDAGIHPSFLGPTCMVVRTMPIRVGHIMKDDYVVGHSGPFYPDSVELDWERDLPGIEPERTTVTKRIRRIASWSNKQYLDALSLNRPTITALNFCNYLKDAGELDTLLSKMTFAHDQARCYPKIIFGFGPCVEDVTESLDEAMAWYDGRSF